MRKMETPKLFLDNIINAEKHFQENLFNYGLPKNKRDERMIENLLKINSCKALVLPDFKDYPHNNPEFFFEGIGISIELNRKIGRKDEEIYSRIILNRDRFLQNQGIDFYCHQTFVKLHLCHKIYDEVFKGLKFYKI